MMRATRKVAGADAAPKTTMDSELFHVRTQSQSTTASFSPSSAASPVSDAQYAMKNIGRSRCQPKDRGPSAVLKENKVQRRKRAPGAAHESGFRSESRAAGPQQLKRDTMAAIAHRRMAPKPVSSRTAATKTPHLLPRQPRAEISKSPGGTDYLVTPGRHCISMTEFLSSFDKKAPPGCPALRAANNYIHVMHREWIEREKEIDGGVFMLSFDETYPLEQFRQMAIQTVFNYAIEHRLHEKTVHLTVLNICRLIFAQTRASSEKQLTHDMFGCTVIAALRHAIKNDESYEKSDRFRLDPQHVWRSSPFLAPLCQDQSVAKLNKVEADCLKMLESPNNPPLAPEFFDRYLEVGCWPCYQDQYRELGAYLMGLALFSYGESTNLLRGTPSSQLAAAALILAVKVINTDNSISVKYQFWPERLEAYTGFTLDSLKPAIRGLAALLRNKPKHSQILEKYYSKWSEYDWN